MKRPIIIDGDIGIVELTKGYFAGIDAADAELVGQWNWHSHVCNGEIYAARGENNPKATIYLHRFLCESEEVVDHKNGVKLDNRRFNLRPCSVSGNTKSSSTSKNGHSRFKGVYPKSGAENIIWIAQITVDYKNIYLGSFLSEEEAAMSYNEAAVEMHGEYAKLNEVMIATTEIC